MPGYFDGRASVSSAKQRNSIAIMATGRIQSHNDFSELMSATARADFHLGINVPLPEDEAAYLHVKGTLSVSWKGTGRTGASFGFGTVCPPGGMSISNVTNNPDGSRTETREFECLRFPLPPYYQVDDMAFNMAAGVDASVGTPQEASFAGNISVEVIPVKRSQIKNRFPENEYFKETCRLRIQSDTGIFQTCPDTPMGLTAIASAGNGTISGSNYSWDERVWLHTPSGTFGFQNVEFRHGQTGDFPVTAHFYGNVGVPVFCHRDQNIQVRGIRVERIMSDPANNEPIRMEDGNVTDTRKITIFAIGGEGVTPKQFLQFNYLPGPDYIEKISGTEKYGIDRVEFQAKVKKKPSGIAASVGIMVSACGFSQSIDFLFPMEVPF